MKCGLRKLVACILLVGAGAAPAQDAAVEQDDVLLRYGLAMENLAYSVEVLPTDSAAANTEIERALNAMLTLSENTSSTALVGAMERVFERARIAVQNQSAVDLEVQAAVLEGGFRRLVYESALRAAAEGDLETAVTRLERIGVDVGLPVEATTALREQADGAASLRYLTEAAVAERLRTLLQAARAQAIDNRDLAYRTTADAYGTLLLIQDSPRVGTSVNDDFVAAIGALVGGDDAALDAALGRLDTSLAAAAESARNALAGMPDVPMATATVGPLDDAAPAVAETAEAAPATPAETAAPADATAQATPTETGATPPVETVAPAEAAPATALIEPAPATTLIEPADAEPIGESAAADPLAGLAASASELASAVEREQQAERDAVMRELAPYALPEAARGALADRMIDAGYPTLQSVLGALYSVSAQAVVEVEDGDQAGAKERIAEFDRLYGAYLGPLIAPRDPAFDRRTGQLTERLGGALALRLQDVVILAGHVDAMQSVLADDAPSVSHNATVSTALFWTGLVRLVVIVVFGLLAFVPLFLLNLAFGGGNRNWQLIGVALFLLLLPIIYESFAFLGSLIAQLTGIAAFELLASYSIFQNTISQVVWAGVTALAVGFAIAGLYGICVQFGLLGRRGPAVARGPGDTVGTTTEIRADTIVDWDEEF